MNVLNIKLCMFPYRSMDFRYLHILSFAFFCSSVGLFLYLTHVPLTPLALVLPSVRPPTLVNWAYSSFWSSLGSFEAACVLGKRHHEQSSQGTLYEPLGCVMFVYLACLPPIILCVWGLARFAGHDAWLSWWKCILAQRMDKGRGGEGTRVRVGGLGWWFWGCWLA